MISSSAGINEKGDASFSFYKSWLILEMRYIDFITQFTWKLGEIGILGYHLKKNVDISSEVANRNWVSK